MFPLLTLLLCSLILVCQSDGRAAARRRPPQAYAHLLQPTERRCRATRDCIGERRFCLNGSVCLRSRCWRLPHFPCASVAWCDERRRECMPRVCQSWRDCDDGVYCNGEELCIEGLCVLNPGSDCSGTGDLCDERAQRCTRVLAVEGARQRLLAAGDDLRVQATLHAMNASNTSNTTVPVGSISNAELAWILVGIGGAVCVFVFFWFIANTSRRRAPAILIDHKSAADGGTQVYTEELNY
jgi:hypothetical protein